MELLTPEEIVRLSPSERIVLIAQLWDNLKDHLASAFDISLSGGLFWIDEGCRLPSAAPRRRFTGGD